jgi:hypothetical protein
MRTLCSARSPAGVPASGAIVFSSLFVLLSLGVCGILGLHAYVHRDDSIRRDAPPQVILAAPSESAVDNTGNAGNAENAENH